MNPWQQAKERYLKASGNKLFCPKAALIDMDGVLFDSMPHHAKSWTTVIHELGIAFDEKEAYLHEGRTGRGTIEILFRRELHRDPTEDEVQSLYAKKAALFDALPQADVIPGAPALLDTIRDSGLTRILVTGSGQRQLLDRIDQFYPNHFSPERMVTAFDVQLGKPYPEPYLKGLMKAGVAAHEAVVIENAPLGIEAGKAAGIFCIAVNTGPLEDEYLWNAGCDALFHSMDELRMAWNEIIQAVTV